MKNQVGDKRTRNFGYVINFKFSGISDQSFGINLLQRKLTRNVFILTK